MAAIIYMMRKMSQSMECMSRVMSSLVPIVKQVELRLDAIMGNPLDQARHLEDDISSKLGDQRCLAEA